MIRKIITIDQEKCDGCGLCVTACHEGAIVLENGKAALLRDDYCDGLGDCLPACPQGAINFEEREALPYDEAAVMARQKNLPQSILPHASGQCPGSRATALHITNNANNAVTGASSPEEMPAVTLPSMLRQWPVQIRLVPVQASFFQDAHLLVAADCCAYARANFHADFMRGKITLIGCPKLDCVDYTEKLRNILQHNTIQSITLVRMSVPCCGGLAQAIEKALGDCGKSIPFHIHTLTPEGNILK